MIFEFIEGWRNLHRRHSGLNYLSPIEYEGSHSARALLPQPNAVYLKLGRSGPIGARVDKVETDDDNKPLPRERV
jgi:hypothetical protein